MLTLLQMESTHERLVVGIVSADAHKEQFRDGNFDMWAISFLRERLIIYQRTAVGWPFLDSPLLSRFPPFAKTQINSHQFEHAS